MTGRVTVIALAISLLAAPGYGASARKKAPEPPPPPPPQFRVDVATRSLSLQRTFSELRDGLVVGDYFDGLLCLRSTIPIYAQYALPGNAQDYVRTFDNEARAAGYRVPDGQGALFGDGSNKPELAVGAVIKEMKERGCGTAGTIDATITVDWQVFDPLDKKLLFRSTNQGSATANSKSAPLANRPAEAGRLAFQQAAKAILADPNFVAAVRDPKGGAPPEPGVLFPEAQNAADSASPVQIVRLAPNTKPFKDQVSGLREQVVTVDNGAGTGSGFYIADGLLLTNHHVIAGAQRVKIRFFGGRQIDGQVVVSNARRDVALIKTDGVGVAGLPLRLEDPELTSQVFVIGSPLGQKHEGSITAGIVSAFRTESGGPFIQSDVAVDHGNSGGPMFDAQGNVIGLVDLGRGERATVNLFIPISDALKVLDIRFVP